MRRLTVHGMAVPLRIDAYGIVRVGPTRVTLDTVVWAYRDGCNAEEIVEQYPALSLPDVHGVIAYYLTHRAEVDAYLASREAEADDLRLRIEATPENRALRERILSRQTGRRAVP